MPHRNAIPCRLCMKIRSTEFMFSLLKSNQGTLRKKSLLFLMFFVLAGCTSRTAPAMVPKVSATPVPSATFTAFPSGTPTPTAVAVRTPPALPGLFETNLLDPLDSPHPYISDTCQYLQDKWS